MPDCQRIGRYEVTAELGRGSMGIVHRAHDPVMDRAVAIKTILLPRGLDADRRESFRERFRREAQTAGRLSHPGIVTVYEFGQDPDREPPFIAMEYVEGPTLHELICAEGALSPAWALDMAETLADALIMAHEGGVVHRDLKPANILVRESDGVAKIADFGVARVNHSNAGKLYGSPAYLSPECIRGETADGRSDLFSLAVIFYETLSGKRPFGGKDFDTICHAIKHDPPDPIRRHAADLCPAFDRFFAKALAKNPHDRFQDAASFRDAIAALRDEQAEYDIGVSTCILPAPSVPAQTKPDEPAPAPPWKDAAREAIVRRWKVIGPAALLIVLLGFVAGWGLRGTRPADARLPGEPAPVVEATPPAEPADAVVPPPTLAESFPTLEPVRTPVLDLAEPAAGTPAPAEPTRPPERAGDRAGGESGRPVDGKDKRRSSPAATPESRSATEPVDARVAAGDSAGVPAAGAAPEPAATAPGAADANAAAPATAHLTLLIKNGIREGELTVLVDGEEIYSTDLETTSGRFSRALRKTVGKAEQQLETEVEIPAGPHVIVARAFSAAKSKTFENSLEIELEPGETRGLTIVTGRTFGRRVVIRPE